MSSHIMKPIKYEKRMNFAMIFTDVFLNVIFPGDTSCYLDNQFKRNSLAYFYASIKLLPLNVQ